MHLKEKAMDVLKTIYDPEIPVDIWELGLIYELEEVSEGKLKVEMTLTSPACPVAESLPGEVYRKLMAIDGVEEGDLRVVWSRPWRKEKMSDEARLTLNMF